jgi:hypothetical protein
MGEERQKKSIFEKVREEPRKKVAKEAPLLLSYKKKPPNQLSWVLVTSEYLR